MAKRMALIVGINDYGEQSGLEILNYAQDDANHLMKALVDLGGFVPTVLSGADATPDRIIGALRSFYSQSDLALFLFYFAGHGEFISEVGMHCLHCYGSQAGDTVGTLNLSEWSARIRNNVPARHIVLIIDACRNKVYRGAQHRGPNPGLNASVYSALKAVSDSTRDIAVGPRSEIEDPRLLFTLLGCGAGQVSYEDPELRHGIFTHALVEEIIANGRQIPLSELRKTVGARTYDWCKRKRWFPEQIPEWIEPSLPSEVYLLGVPDRDSDRPDGGQVGATLDSERALYVIPTRSKLPRQSPPLGFTLPPGYEYVGKVDGLPADHLYRIQDGHVGIMFPELLGVTQPFVIDKYTITAEQYSVCLNDLMSRGLVSIKCDPACAIKRGIDLLGRLLIIDARDYYHWQRSSGHREPWLYASLPWGLTFESGEWKPIVGSELLPATLVTWWGARTYSLWCHCRISQIVDERAVHLPTAQQWQTAALLDPVTKRQSLYPWGQVWNRMYVNYAGYWASQEVRGDAGWERFWARVPEVYSQTRPLCVAALLEGHSHIGCVQMLGNVWEWCADAPREDSARRIVKGGACNSPQEHCTPGYPYSWRSNQGNHYVGFRCGYAL